MCASIARVMSKMLTLSIVIPVHNEESHIKACLDAILAQNVLPLEIVVVDNNCSDKTIDIAKKYDLVRVVKELKPGIAYARNTGFDTVRGDIIGRIDADTILPENWVSHVSEFISKNPDHALTGGSYFYDLKPARFFGWMQGQIAFRVNRLIIGHYITWGSNMALHNSLWKKVRHKVHNDRLIHEDMDLGIHLHEHGYKITYQAGFKVGIDSRLFSPKRNTRKMHLEYLKMWPRTLNLHQNRRVWIGWVGVYIIYFSYHPLFIVHWLAGKVSAK